MTKELKVYFIKGVKWDGSETGKDKQLVDLLISASRFFPTMSSNKPVSFDDFCCAVSEKIIARCKLIMSQEQKSTSLYDVLFRSNEFLAKDMREAGYILDNAEWLFKELLRRGVIADASKPIQVVGRTVDGAFVATGVKLGI
jgi:hypothetical protein